MADPYSSYDTRSSSLPKLRSRLLVNLLRCSEELGAGRGDRRDCIRSQLILRLSEEQNTGSLCEGTIAALTQE